MGRYIFTESDIKFLTENYPKMGAKWCADILSLSVGQIVSKTSRLGLKQSKECKTKTYSESKIKYEKSRDLNSFSVNPKIFTDLNNEYSIYLLGLIWADGHVTYANNKSKTPLIKHTSIENDSEDFLSIFLKTGDWKNFIYENKKLGYKPVRIINTSNRVLGEWLVDNGYRDKNGCPKFLDKIPENLLHYFYRGLSDGDGCFEHNIKHGKSYHKKQLKFTLSSGCNQNWSFVESVFNKLGLSYGIRNQENKKGCTSYIHLKNKESLVWAEYIYGGMDFGLTRKKNKWLEVLQHNNQLLMSNQ